MSRAAHLASIGRDLRLLSSTPMVTLRLARGIRATSGIRVTCRGIKDRDTGPALRCTTIRLCHPAIEITPRTVNRPCRITLRGKGTAITACPRNRTVRQVLHRHGVLQTSRISITQSLLLRPIVSEKQKHWTAEVHKVDGSVCLTNICVSVGPLQPRETEANVR